MARSLGATREGPPPGLASCACRGSGGGLCTGAPAASGGCSGEHRGSGLGALTATRGVLPGKQVCSVWHHLPPSNAAHGASTCHCGPNATETFGDTDSRGRSQSDRNLHAEGRPCPQNHFPRGCHRCQGEGPLQRRGCSRTDASAEAASASRQLCTGRDPGETPCSRRPSPLTALP